MTGRETILIAEDNDSIRIALELFLELYGYTVICAIDGLEAIKKATEYEGPIHVLITDIIMPKMSGVNLATAILKERPKVVVIFMSGYSQEELSKYSFTMGSSAFISKPSSMLTVLRNVRELLDQQKA